jgi:hypothetical protein
MAIPDSEHCKLFRAKEHLDGIQVETQRYYQANPAKVVRQQKGSPDEFIGRVVTNAPIPKRIPLIIGDFLQNLRSSLDYLVWELVLSAKNTPDHNNMFPICTTPEAFRGQLAIAEIEALQPCHDGQDTKGNVLAMIDDLCNVNKHRRILTTILYGGQAPSDLVTHETDGEMFANVSFESILKQGTEIGPFPMVDGPDGRFPKVDAPVNFVAFIAFDDGAAQNVEVGYTLSIFMGYVMQILRNFEKFFI